MGKTIEEEIVAQKYYIQLASDTKGIILFLSGAKGTIGIFWVVCMDFKEFYMVWGGNVGIWLQINIIGTHGHKKYLKPPPKTSQDYPRLQVGIQVELEHFVY